MATKIYTRTGDKGSTSLIGGTKVSKSDLRIETYGTVDELNAHIGLCRDSLQDQKSRGILLEIQDRLFSIGSILACDPEKDIRLPIPEIGQKDVVLLEKEIDRMNNSIPPMKNFILPGGHMFISFLHVARCVCRRAERACVKLKQEGSVDPLILKYLNRLSDYLFILARYSAHLMKVEEIPWKPRI